MSAITNYELRIKIHQLQPSVCSLTSDSVFACVAVPCRKRLAQMTGHKEWVRLGKGGRSDGGEMFRLFVDGKARKS